MFREDDIDIKEFNNFESLSPSRYSGGMYIVYRIPSIEQHCLGESCTYICRSSRKNGKTAILVSGKKTCLGAFVSKMTKKEKVLFLKEIKPHKHIFGI